MVVYSDRSRNLENEKNEIKDKQYDFYTKSWKENIKNKTRH